MQPHAWHDNPPDTTEGDDVVTEAMRANLFASVGMPKTGTGK